MGLFDAIVGGVTGFLSGGPAGAAVGALGGLASHGGTAQSTATQIMRRAYTPAEAQVYNMIQKRLPGLLEKLGPDQQQQFINEAMNVLNTQGEKKLDEYFNQQEAKMSAAMKRTGGDLGSVALYRRKELAGEHARASGEMRAQNMLTANQLGLARSDAILRTAGGLAGIATSYDAMRNIGQTQTVSKPNSFMETAFQAMGHAVTSPYSYFGRQWGFGNQDNQDKKKGDHQ